MRKLVGAAAAIVAIMLGGLVASAQTLKIGLGAEVISVDPQFFDSSVNKTVTTNIFEGLIEADFDNRLHPSLAESWRLVDDLTWEFTLRRGVKFHNGAELTADDAAATIARVATVPNAPQRFTTYTRAIDHVDVDGPYKLRIHTQKINPLIPNGMAQIRVVNAVLARDMASDAFNSGKAAIGTGPYRLVSYRSGEAVVLERNENYWGAKPAWQNVTYRMLTNPGARVSALLADDVQLIDQVPSADADVLRGNGAIRLKAPAVGARIIVLQFNFNSGPPTFITGADGEPLSSNPLNDVRVRKALSIGIDRTAIVDRIMTGIATAAGQMMRPGGFGFAPEVPVPAYDPEQAKRLLAEAGFPNGLRLTLHGGSGRWPNDTQVIQAVAQMWQRIGVRTTVEALPYSIYTMRVVQGGYSVMTESSSPVTGESSIMLLSALATKDTAKGFGGANHGHYSNPAFDDALNQAMNTLDDTAREALLKRAAVIAADDYALMPLYLLKSTWAMRKPIDYTARADDQTRIVDVHVAP